MKLKYPNSSIVGKLFKLDLFKKRTLLFDTFLHAGESSPSRLSTSRDTLCILRARTHAYAYTLFGVKELFSEKAIVSVSLSVD